MSDKTKVIVTHPSLYLRVSGKLQEVAVGTELTMDSDRADKLVKKGFAMDPSKAKKAAVDEKKKKKPEPKKPEPKKPEPKA